MNKDYTSLNHHPMMEKIVNILRKNTQNEDPIFFRLVVSYFFCKLASMMRCNVQLAETQIIPVNMYAINLAPSGSGKGHSINIIEEQIINQFRRIYLDETFPKIAERSLANIAIKRSIKHQSEEEDEILRANIEFDELGQLLFSFDSATPAALKQMRTKLQMATAGSMNLEIDEIGSNLLNQGEALDSFLELFDMGKIKPKLIKNTRENVRAEDLFGNTPTNMLLFGTPTKLFDGGKTEEEYHSFIETGYARRCFFGLCRRRLARVGQTAEDIYNIYNNVQTTQYLATISDSLAQLADVSQFNQTIRMRKDVSLALFNYQIFCQDKADELSEYDEIQKAELVHRYFKVIKLAAAYSFIDKAAYVNMHHLENAIAMAEDSGIAFKNMIRRDRPYAKLCNYLALHHEPLTITDLIEDLPFYKGSVQQRTDMLNLAIQYGYKHGISIRRDIIDGIEFLSGKAVPKTDLNKMIVSVSKDIVTGYSFHKVTFIELHNMVATSNWHWINHKLKDGYRAEANIQGGCNMVVLDVENSVSVSTAQLLLRDYKYLIYTTKRHTSADNRYRIVLPMSHYLELDEIDYKEFMQNIFDWLPFDVDTATGQRSRKWLSFKGNHWYNDGKLLDSLQFIPKTKKADEHKALIATQGSLSGLERWFLNNTCSGNRNNQLLKYGFALIDMGQDLMSIQNNVLDLNRKLSHSLDETEVLTTVMSSVTKKFHTKGKI